MPDRIDKIRRLSRIVEVQKSVAQSKLGLAISENQRIATLKAAAVECEDHLLREMASRITNQAVNSLVGRERNAAEEQYRAGQAVSACEQRLKGIERILRRMSADDAAKESKSMGEEMAGAHSRHKRSTEP